MSIWFAQAAANNDSAYLWWGLLLVVVAVVLFMVEFVVPSGGLLGLLAGVAAVGSVVAFLQYDTTLGIGVGVGYLVLTPIAIVFGFKVWLNSPLARKMILGGPPRSSHDEDNQTSVEEQRQKHEEAERLRALIGAEGTAATDLRPVGVVIIEGRRIDAMAEAGVIDVGSEVVVSDVYDNQIKVRLRN